MSASHSGDWLQPDLLRRESEFRKWCHSCCSWAKSWCRYLYPLGWSSCDEWRRWNITNWWQTSWYLDCNKRYGNEVNLSPDKHSCWFIHQASASSPQGNVAERATEGNILKYSIVPARDIIFQPVQASEALVPINQYGGWFGLWFGSPVGADFWWHTEILLSFPMPIDHFSKNRTPWREATFPTQILAKPASVFNYSFFSLGISDLYYRQRGPKRATMSFKTSLIPCHWILN